MSESQRDLTGREIVAANDGGSSRLSRRRLLRAGGVSAGLAGLAVTTTMKASPAWASGTSPTGPAGGSLTGSYPDPGIGAGSIGDAHIDSTDPIGRDKLAPPEARHVVGNSGEPAFGSGWSNVGSGGRDLCFWYDDGTELVHIEGMITTTGVGATVFTLPSGYRPAANMIGPAKELFGSTLLDWGVVPGGAVTIAPVSSLGAIGLAISFRLGA